jgi:uncharacterized membrane protein YhaH (DUF805 family)
VTADTRQSDAGAARRPSWRDPHQLAGRSQVSDLVLGVMILVGAAADMVAFKTTLDILLRQSQTLSWVMASGATCLALVAAARLGVAVAIRRREDTRYASFAVLAAAIAWLGLGLAMFITRLLNPGSAGPAFETAAPQSTQPTTLIAIFFGAVYLISGTCMMIEAMRLHNPEAALHRRLGKSLDKQVARTAEAEAEAERAQRAVDLHNDELAREKARYHAAINARKALALEAASHARLRMSAILGDPSKTAITETEPALELPPGGGEDEPDPD